MNTKRTEFDAASFRDPDGRIHHLGGEIIREIYNERAPILDPQYAAFFSGLTADRHLVPSEAYEEGQQPACIQGLGVRLEPLPLITYPYEWSFCQLRDAAVKTLDIALMALDAGLGLKDATAYNVQIDRGDMIFIDHTSFEPSDGRMPWVPYGQFCRHFVAPLFLTSYLGVNAINWLKLYLDGIDIVDAARMMPLRARLNLHQLIHVYFHARLAKKHQKDFSSERRKTAGIFSSKVGQKDFLLHLKRVIAGIRLPTAATQWHQYYEFTNYARDDFRHKEAFIDGVFAGSGYHTVWDIGANNGHFSRVAARHSALVLAMDIDFRAVDENWQTCRRQNIGNVVPLVFDILNPSPGVGFANAERPPLTERSRPDAILALALVHHLVISGGLRFAQLAEYLRQFSADLIVEFADRPDSQVEKLFQSIRHDRPDYTLDNFRTAFSEHFELVRTERLGASERHLFHLEPN